MYTPKYFKKVDKTIVDEFIRQNDFATVVSCEGTTPVATHIPIEFVQNENDEKFIYGHLARGNRQWRTFKPNNEVLVILSSGSHTYVSPRWYNHINVPTWNYMMVHMYGKPRVIKDRNELYSIVKRLVDKYESNAKASKKYRLETLPQDFVESELKGIVGFEIKVDRTEVNFKLSQNRNQEDYENIIAKLRSSGNTEAEAVADVMARNQKSLFDEISKTK